MECALQNLPCKSSCASLLFSFIDVKVKLCPLYLMCTICFPATSRARIFGTSVTFYIPGAYFPRGRAFSTPRIVWKSQFPGYYRVIHELCNYVLLTHCCRARLSNISEISTQNLGLGELIH